MSIRTAEKVVKAAPFTVLKAEDGRREITHAITRRIVDRDGDVVEPMGARLDNYKKNPVVLFGHDPWSFPIGKNVSMKKAKDDIIAVTRFAGVEQAHDQAEVAYRLTRDGFLNSWSIGFIPITISDDVAEEGQRGLWIKEWELLEYSLVPIPSNPDAVNRFVKAYGLPTGATEQDLLQAVGKAPLKFFSIATGHGRPATISDREASDGIALLKLMKQEGTQVQSVVCSKDTFETQADATAWVRDHDFSVPEGGPDETEASWRYRQFPPGDCVEGGLENGETFATIRLDDGVSGVVCRKGEAAAHVPLSVVEAIQKTTQAFRDAHKESNEVLEALSVLRNSSLEPTMAVEPSSVVGALDAFRKDAQPTSRTIWKCDGKREDGHRCERRLMETTNEIRYGRAILLARCPRCAKVNSLDLQGSRTA